jgi:hypothetical protein
VARCRSEAAVTCDQCSAELFGQDNIGTVIGRKVVTALPYLRQQNKVGIPRDPEIQQIALSRSSLGKQLRRPKTPRFRFIHFRDGLRSCLAPQLTVKYCWLAFAVGGASQPVCQRRHADRKPAQVGPDPGSGSRWAVAGCWTCLFLEGLSVFWPPEILPHELNELRMACAERVEPPHRSGPGLFQTGPWPGEQRTEAEKPFLHTSGS